MPEKQGFWSGLFGKGQKDGRPDPRAEYREPLSPSEEEAARLTKINETQWQKDHE